MEFKKQCEKFIYSFFGFSKYTDVDRMIKDIIYSIKTKIQDEKPINEEIVFNIFKSFCIKPGTFVFDQIKYKNLQGKLKRKLQNIVKSLESGIDLTQYEDHWIPPYLRFQTHKDLQNFIEKGDENTRIDEIIVAVQYYYSPEESLKQFMEQLIENNRRKEEISDKIFEKVDQNKPVLEIMETITNDELGEYGI